MHAWHQQRILEADTEFFKAIRDQDIIAVQRLLADDPQAVHDHHEQTGETPLHVASSNPTCPSDITQILLSHGADPNAPALEDYASRPLHHASRSGNASIVHLLLKAGADPKAEGGYQRDTPLEIAINHGYAALISLFLDVEDKGCFINRRVSSDGMNPDWIRISLIHRAALSGYASSVSTILEKGRGMVDLEERNELGRTPLLSALWSCNREHDDERTLSPEQRRECVEVLVDAGADLTARDAEGRSVFLGAARCGCKDIIEMLLARCWNIQDDGSTPTPPDQSPPQPQSQPQSQPLFLRSDRKLPFLTTALHLSTKYKHHGIASLLLTRGASIHSLDSEGRHPLHRALPSKNTMSFPESSILTSEISSSLQMIDLLLQHGAWIDAPDTKGRTPLHLSAKIPNSFPIIEHLLEKGAAMDTQSSDSWEGTPLLAACNSYQRSSTDTRATASVELLLQHGANVNIRNLRGATVLHRASQLQSADFALILLRHGADANARDMCGMTPILCAARTGRYENVAILREFGAAENAIDNSGHNLLYYLSVGEENARRTRHEMARHMRGGFGRGRGIFLGT
jgi:ankyrin repeat protein